MKARGYLEQIAHPVVAEIVPHHAALPALLSRGLGVAGKLLGNDNRQVSREGRIGG
jgi:hypothetical protein